MEARVNTKWLFHICLKIQSLVKGEERGTAHFSLICIPENILVKAGIQKYININY